ncbi:hypothetical protein [Salinisphaera orenii]|uniref:hypothetical protein n=1 Tax=Salinisphaera orenii TaxID=856731 RepID=UPI000DBE512E
MPSPIRRVAISKPQGGVRILGILMLTNRLVQQALHQVSSPLYEPGSSNVSYAMASDWGKRSLEVEAARQYAAGGAGCWYMDLEKLFDRVDLDLLMS